MPGRKPKPIERQIAEGDPRKVGKAKLEAKLSEQIKATSGLPHCPRHLKGRARYAWTFWAEELQVMKLDKRPDAPMLEGACRAYERAVKADLILDESGLIVEDKFIEPESGEVIVLRVRKHPAVEVSNRSWLIVKAFCCEFGLTPAARMRVKVETGKDDDDDLVKVLSQARQPQPQSTGSAMVQ